MNGPCAASSDLCSRALSANGYIAAMSNWMRPWSVMNCELSSFMQFDPTAVSDFPDIFSISILFSVVLSHILSVV